jgi:hypothetical protein
MRFVHLYLMAYALLVIGALVTLYTGGVLQRVSGGRIAMALLVAAGLGVMLAITSRKPAVTGE